MLSLLSSVASAATLRSLQNTLIDTLYVDSPVTGAIVLTGSEPKNIKNFRVEDNMMAPEFNCDEHVLVDLSDCTPSPPGTFIVSDGFGFLLRNCEPVPNSDPVKIKITALKDSFEPQTLTLDEFQIIGRVIAKLQWL